MTDFDFKQFKRMNYFTGFFTTADDWSAEQNYHMNKLRLHNQGVHTPGIMRNWMDELKVTAVGNRILVQSGAVLDGGGNEIYVGEQVEVLPAKSFGDYTKPQTLYVTIEYNAIESDPVINPTQPEYNGNTRWKEEAKVSITETEPDNNTVLELARIFLRPPVSMVANPIDPASPGANEIDRRSILYAGSVCASDSSEWLEQAIKDRLIICMQNTRKSFSDLEGRFPVPSLSDVRHGAVTMEMLARAGVMQDDKLSGLLYCLALIENDVGNEIGDKYPGLVGLYEYGEYVAAVQSLQTNIAGGFDNLLNCQDRVTLAAQELSEVVLRSPDAYTGGNQSVMETGDEGKVTLDASASKAYGDRTIARYTWDLQSSIAIPRAAAGINQTVVAVTGDQAVVRLDAHDSMASGGQRIASYLWKLTSRAGLPKADAGGDRVVTSGDGESSVILDASASGAAVGERIKKYRWDEV